MDLYWPLAKFLHITVFRSNQTAQLDPRDGWDARKDFFDRVAHQQFRMILNANPEKYVEWHKIKTPRKGMAQDANRKNMGPKFLSYYIIFISYHIMSFTGVTESQTVT